MIKFFKFVLILLFYHSPLYSKSKSLNDINSRHLSNYFSGIVAYDNSHNDQALKFFKLSKHLIKQHNSYLESYTNTLVLEGRVQQAVSEIKQNLTGSNSNFFEAYLLLTLDSIKRSDFKKSNKYLKQLSKFRDSGTFEMIIYETLKDYVYVFKNKKLSEEQNSFGNLSLINKVFQNCYLNEEKTYGSLFDIIQLL